MIRIITASILLILTSTASAQQTPNWALVTATRTGTAIYQDIGTIRSSGTIRRAWRAEIYREAKPFAQKAVQGEKALGEHDCSQRRSRTLSYILYARDGSIIRSWTSQKPEWDYDLPGSIGDSLTSVTCGTTKPMPTKSGFDPIEQMEVIIGGLNKL